MDRYTRKDAERAFVRLIEAIGGKVANSYEDKGCYQLDWNSTYGGGNIELLLVRGGVSQPFGSQRHNAREFCAMCRFAIDTLREMEQRKGQAA